MLTKKEQRLRRARQTAYPHRHARRCTSDCKPYQPAHLRQRYFWRRRQSDGYSFHRRSRSAQGIGRYWQGRQRRRGCRSLASAWLKKPRLLVLKRSHLTAQALRTTAVSRRWLMPRVKLACSSKQIGIHKWLKFKQKCKVRPRVLRTVCARR